MTYIREKRTTNTIVGLREDGIIETRQIPQWNGEGTVALAKETLEAVVEVSGGVLRPALNFLPDTPVTQEVRDFYAQQEPTVLASAMVTQSLIQKMLGNFFMTINKLKVPTQLFTDEEKAVKWLKGFMMEQTADTLHQDLHLF